MKEEKKLILKKKSIKKKFFQTKIIKDRISSQKNSCKASSLKYPTQNLTIFNSNLHQCHLKIKKGSRHYKSTVDRSRNLIAMMKWGSLVLIFCSLFIVLSEKRLESTARVSAYLKIQRCLDRWQKTICDITRCDKLQSLNKNCYYQVKRTWIVESRIVYRFSS